MARRLPTGQVGLLATGHKTGGGGVVVETDRQAGGLASGSLERMLASAKPPLPAPLASRESRRVAYTQPWPASPRGRKDTANAAEVVS